MLGRMMDNYYYGKSGKGDFRKEDLPKNRWELFWSTLRTRLSALCRLNLMYAVVWLPAMLVILISFVGTVNNLGTIMAARDGTLTRMVEEGKAEYTEEGIALMKEIDAGEYLNSSILRALLILIPCIAITGPATAGVSYVTRNWARDEHAFIWTDFKDAVKENWKQGLLFSVITALLPALVFVAWRFYGQMAARQPVMMIPQMLVVMIAVVWALCATYFYPLMVTYQLNARGVMRNGILMGIARLPMSIGIRLLHCVPAAIGFALCYFWNPLIGALLLFAYYLLIGFALSRFVSASYTNAVFDRYLNPRIEGAKINQGLRETDDDGDDDDGDEDAEPERNAGQN